LQTAHDIQKMAGERFSPLSTRSERDLLRSRHPNLLIVGAAAARASAIRELRPFLRHTIVATSVAVPGEPAAARTLVLENVAALTAAEQHDLLTWLEARGEGTQVITTADRSLLPLVKKGHFLEALYYRLNVVYLDLTA
jgi:hypothetical protein